MTTLTAFNVQMFVKALFVMITCAGYGLLECGALRSQNVVHSLFKNLILFVLTAFCYWSTGYAFAFGFPANEVLGYRFWFSENLNENRSALVSGDENFRMDPFFHMFFHFTLTYLVVLSSSASFAERLRLKGYSLFCVLFSGFLYPILSHWVWFENGWLSKLGVKDAFGSLVIFLPAGIAGLLGTLFLGPRIGRFQPRAIPLFGHNLPVTATGNLLIYVGLSAMNSGQCNKVPMRKEDGILGRGLLSTVLSGAFAGITFCIIDYIMRRKNRRLKRRLYLSFSNSIIAGMVAMSAGSIYYEQWSACIIGCVAALVYIGISKAITYIKIDDPADIAAVHISGGLVGTLALPLLKRYDNEPSVIFNPQTGKVWLNLLWSICAILCVSVWTIFFTGLYFYIVTFLKSFKIDREAEIRGVDLFEYGEPAYALRIYCASCGDQLQSRTANHDSDQTITKGQQNIITDAEGG